MSDIDRANKAKAVLEAPGFEDAFQAVRSAIIERIEKCSLTDTTTAEQLRTCLKLLKDVRLNLELAVSDGKLAEFRIAEAEKRSKNPIRNMFRKTQ